MQNVCVKINNRVNHFPKPQYIITTKTPETDPTKSFTKMEAQEAFFILTKTIGFISLTKILFRVLQWIWINFLRPSKNLKSYGSWALITGSTDGIGKALAFELASKGLNLVLVGRDPLKLEHTCKAILERSHNKVQVKSIVIDFAKDSGDELVKRIEKGIEGIDVGLVVNNAGMGYPYAKYFHELESDVVDSVVKVNVEGATWVTKAVVPAMLKKKKGAIVNIGSGSVSAVPSYPLYSVYAATKSYIETFSRSIGVEYKKQGIDVQCQVPMLVATKLASIRRSSLFVPSPEMYSKASVRMIGYELICTPYWSHSLQWGLLGALPDSLVDSVLLKYFLGVRKKGQQKELMKNKNKNL